MFEVTLHHKLSHNYKTWLDKNVKPKELLCLDPSKPNFKWVSWQGSEIFSKDGKVPKDKINS